MSLQTYLKLSCAKIVHRWGEVCEKTEGRGQKPIKEMLVMTVLVSGPLKRMYLPQGSLKKCHKKWKTSIIFLTLHGTILFMTLVSEVAVLMVVEVLAVVVLIIMKYAGV